MLGNFQSSELRIEVEASEVELRDNLTRPDRLQQWLWPQQFSAGLPEQFYPGLTFQSWVGPIRIQHRVEVVEPHCLRMILSEAIDGFHEWYWGEGWVQSRLEGVSLLPLNLSQTWSLMRLRDFLRSGQQV
uniref:Activator of Hsp90 ATPase 1 family protein n=1 Tax=Cyanothece sp. (strain PCC 7425 / ATCC 29141) TaxID=395961 RepID=B8HUQ1_CYAP4